MVGVSQEYGLSEYCVINVKCDCLTAPTTINCWWFYFLQYANRGGVKLASLFNKFKNMNQVPIKSAQPHCTKSQNFLKSRLLGFMTNWTAHAKRRKSETARRAAPH